MADLGVCVLVLLQTLRLYLRFQRQLIHRVVTLQRNRQRLRSRARRLIAAQLRVRRQSPVMWMVPRAQQWWDTIVPDFSPAQFMEKFRVSRESFDYICSQLGTMQRRNTTYRLCVPLRKRIAIAIWKLATGGEYRTVSHLFGVGIATVCRCVQDFCDAVIRVLLQQHIKFPDPAKFAEIASFFESRWGVPQCVGAIDGSHIPIIAPEVYPGDFLNHKGWHSIVLQAIVNGKGEFWDICVGFPGSLHDARVLTQSDVWERLSNGELLSQNKVNICGRDVGYYLIGDPAYPLQKWLMKPFSDTGRLTNEQHEYNYRLNSARSVVEMSFGRLKGRWKCLMKRNDCNLKLTKKMVLACCVLHNICEERGDNFCEDLRAMHVNTQPTLHAVPDNGHPEGANVRAALMECFNRPDR